MGFLSLLPRVVPVVILLLLGFYFRKSRFIGEEAVGGIKKLIVNISLPALLFLAFLEIDFQLRFLVVVISVLVLNRWFFLHRLLFPYLSRKKNLQSVPILLIPYL